jgi:hypothetical protein
MRNGSKARTHPEEKRSRLRLSWKCIDWVAGKRLFYMINSGVNEDFTIPIGRMNGDPDEVPVVLDFGQRRRGREVRPRPSTAWGQFLMVLAG